MKLIKKFINFLTGHTYGCCSKGRCSKCKITELWHKYGENWHYSWSDEQDSEE